MSNNQKKNKIQNNMYRSLLINVILTWIIISLIIITLIININKIHMKTIHIILSFFSIYIIIYLPENVKKIKTLIKYKKKNIDEIENKINNLNKEYCFGKLYFLENSLVVIDKNIIEEVKYNDIICFFREVYYKKHSFSKDSRLICNGWLYECYGEWVIITKNKKILKVNIPNKEKIKLINKILIKHNSNILFDRKQSTLDKVKEIYGVNINSLDVKNAIINYFKSVIIGLIIGFCFICIYYF